MRTANSERLERIIEVAARLFGEQPYHQVRLDDIAAKAGVSKGTVYLHFKDKDDLYMALSLHGLRRMFELVQSTISGLPTPEEKLLGLVREVVGFFTKAPHFCELVQRADAAQSACQSTALLQSRERFRNLLIDIVRELNATQRWDAPDPELAALALIGTLRETNRAGKSGADLPEQIVRLFLHGIARLPCPAGEKPAC